MMITALYADGGVISRNPSPIGGTWAYCLVDEHGQRVKEVSKILYPELGMPLVTNNVTELLALVQGLYALPEDFTGTVYSDSWVSLQRVFLAAKLNNVPTWLIDKLQAFQRTGRLAKMSYVLLDGHPTQAHLLAGKGKRGNPVSEHNVWCDKACGKVAAEAMRSTEVPA